MNFKNFLVFNLLLFTQLLVNASSVIELHQAIWNHNVARVKDNLADAINPNIKFEGKPALHNAIYVGALYSKWQDPRDIEIIKLLLQRGADPLIKDNQNETALDYANKYGNNEVIKLIQEYKK